MNVQLIVAYGMSLRLTCLIIYVEIVIFFLCVVVELMLAYDVYPDFDSILNVILIPWPALEGKEEKEPDTHGMYMLLMTTAYCGFCMPQYNSN